MSTKWQYNWFNTGWHHDANTVLAGAAEQANYLGDFGWELITFQMREKEKEVSIVAMLKRPRIAAKDPISPVRALEESDEPRGAAEELLPAAKATTERSRSKSRKGIRSK